MAPRTRKARLMNSEVRVLALANRGRVRRHIEVDIQSRGEDATDHADNLFVVFLEHQ